MPPWVILLATVLVALAGPWLATALSGRGIDPSPLLLLYLYVFWPWLQLSAAASVAFVVVLAMVLRYAMGTRRVQGKYLCLGDVLLFGAALTLYVGTLAPTVLPADSGEFQFVSYVLGIAHPPGYSLYTMLAKLFTCLPWGDVASRVNLLSAVGSALALVVLSLTVRGVTGSALAGWIAAASLGVAPTYWAQGTTANIRSLTALFVTLQTLFLVLYAESKSIKHLTAFAVVLGLGIAHHSSLVPLLLPYLVFLLLSNADLVRQPRSWKWPVVAFISSFGVLLYLPLRSVMGAPFDPQPIRDLAGFLEHVLALGFRGDMFYFTQPSVLASRVRVLLGILSFQFGPVWWLLAAWGTVALLVRHRRLLLLLAGMFAVNAMLALTYRAPQTVEYLIPAYVALVCINAYGVWALAEILIRRGTWARAAAALLLAVAFLMAGRTLTLHYPSFLRLHQDRSTRQQAETLLTQAPRDARILSGWHHATPLWYLQQVELLRPDVEVLYVYPEGAEPIAQTWLRRVAESIEGSSPQTGPVKSRPTILTNRYSEFQSLPYTLRPFADGWLVETGPAFEVPAGFEQLGALFDGLIEFAGFELNSDQVTPADSLVVRLNWMPAVKLDRDYSFFVHLVDDAGMPLGQGDVTHPAERYEVGQVILDEYHIPLLPTVKPGRYRLIAGVYITLAEGGWRRLVTEGGSDSVPLSEIDVQPPSLAAVTCHAFDRRSASGYVLEGVDYDRSLPDQLRLYLHWRTAGRVEEPHRVMVFSEDTALAAADLPPLLPGEHLSTVHELPVEVAELSIEVHAGSGDAPVRWLGPWQVSLGRRVSLPAPQAEDRYVPLGGQMVLTGAEYPATAQSESALRAVMTFVGTGPLTHDYTVSVKLVSETDEWQGQHDGTPAMGAMPTLKWIRGTTVRDEHTLWLPSEAGGRGVLRLAVYDAFTMEPLPVLDERLARLGQGTAMDLGTIVVGKPK